MSTSTSRMTVSDIAKLAGVQKSTVSNWRKRHDDFPKPLGDVGGRPQFDTEEVRAWLTSRNPGMGLGSGRAADIVRDWRFIVNHVEPDQPTDIMSVFIAAVGGEKLSYGESGDGRYPVRISSRYPDASISATQSQADAISDFLATDIEDVDKAELLEIAAQEFDDVSRWKRDNDSERNLHELLASLVHEDSENILDFACGTGALAAAVSRKHPMATVIAMEPDEVESFVAEARLSRCAFATVEPGDILERDVLSGRQFDAVVSIPPFGALVDSASDRMRRMPFGPVRGTADAAWPQLAVQALTPKGEAFLVLPHSLSFDQRSDSMRRELIRQGTLAAVVTLPANALSSTRTLTDLWVMRHKPKKPAGVLFVDFSDAEPTAADEYEVLKKALIGWLDGGDLLGEDSRFVVMEVIELLGQRVSLDPQFWCVQAATPTSADELLGAVADTVRSVADARLAVVGQTVPDSPLVPEQLTVISVREARDDDLLQVLKFRPDKGGSRLTVADAEEMRAGREILGAANNTASDGDGIRPGDVLVWAGADRQVRTAVSTAGGVMPASPITVLRCNWGLDPDYLAIVLATRRNAMYATGSALPTVRTLELELPLIRLEQQRQISEYALAGRKLAQAASEVVNAVAAFEDALADAVGSGGVGLKHTDGPNSAARTVRDHE